MSLPLRQTQVQPVMDFDSEAPIEVPIVYRGENYVLVEADEATDIEYNSTIMETAKLENGKLVGASGWVKAGPVLLRGCLFKVDAAGNRTPVTLEFVKGLPRRVSQPLIDKVREISRISGNEKEPGNPKGSPPDTTSS